MDRRAFLISATLGGVAIGLLGSLPLFNLVNCLLCLWVWLGGGLAVYLYRRYRPGDPPLTQAQGAGLGALAGVIGAIIGFLVFLVTGTITLPLMEQITRALDMEGSMSFAGGGSGVLIQALIFLAMDLVLYPLFGAVAGLIAVNLLWKKPPAISA